MLPGPAKARDCGFIGLSFWPQANRLQAPEARLGTAMQLQNRIDLLLPSIKVKPTVSNYTWPLISVWLPVR